MGSFYNVCIYRLPRGQSLLKPRSHCTSCGRTLGVIDLIPVVSYLMLKGHCRYCRASVSSRYLLVELICGIGFVAIFHRYYISCTSIFLILIFSIMLIAGFIAFDRLASGRGDSNV